VKYYSFDHLFLSRLYSSNKDNETTQEKISKLKISKEEIRLTYPKEIVSVRRSIKGKTPTSQLNGVMTSLRSVTNNVRFWCNI
jgi:hypothetical protein